MAHKELYIQLYCEAPGGSILVIINLQYNLFLSYYRYQDTESNAR